MLDAGDTQWGRATAFLPTRIASLEHLLGRCVILNAELEDLIGCDEDSKGRFLGS